MSVQTPTLGLFVNRPTYSRPAVDQLTLSVGSTLGSLTGVHTLPVTALSLNTGQTGSTVSVSSALIGVCTASSVGITDISLLTCTHCSVTDDLTLSSRSTGPWTRVTALLFNTGQGAGTLAVLNTLRSAAGWLSDISRQTGTESDTFLVPALRECSTGI